MGRVSTYHFGEGILVLPNGEEWKVKSLTLTMGDPIEVIENGQVVRQEPSKDPIKITVEEPDDGTDK